jgi:hypothetical protein
MEVSMRLLKLSALFALVLLSAVSLLALLAVRSLPASGIGGAGGQVPSRNGDVNCDGRLDITDAIHVLEHLFRGGQEPCALAQGGPGFPEVVGQLERLNDSVSLLAGRLDAVLAAKWPPGPRDIVNLRVTQPGGTEPVFTVPVDRFLIVTDLSMALSHPASSLDLAERREGQTVTKLQLSGRPTLLGDTTTPGIDPLQWHSPVGLVFSPGSEVISAGNRPFELVGYLAPTSL